MNDKRKVKSGLLEIVIGLGIFAISFAIWGIDPPKLVSVGVPPVCTLLWAFGAIKVIQGVNGWDFWAWLFSEKPTKQS